MQRTPEVLCLTILASWWQYAMEASAAARLLAADGTFDDLAGFLAEVDKVVTDHYPDFQIIWFGHIGDGNVHLNVLKPDDLPMDEFQARCGEVSRWVFEIVQRHGGSVSAEHGVGLLKKDYLTYSRSETEIEIMRGIKRVFDPDGIMNPGKIFDL